MPSIILSDNGVSSGSAGLKSTAASDGALALQTTTSGGTATTAVTIDTSQNVTFTNAANLPNTFGFKNRIINGAMAVHQRGGTISANATVNTYGVDRFAMRTTLGSAVVSMQQSTVAPANFYNSLLCTVTTAASSLAADDLTALFQRIEGVNVADLGWGTANAQPVTLSFQVRSSVTGTYGVGVQNDAGNRSYPSTYTINAANTWETKTITIPGDTSGTWNLGTTSTALYLFFSLGAGSNYTGGTTNAWNAADRRGASGQVNWCATLSNTFYITGVQLEKGSTATSFDYRPYGTELALCQRYYFLLFSGSQKPFGIGTYYASNQVNVHLQLPVPMRTTPSLEMASGANYYRILSAGVSDYISSMAFDQGNENIVDLYNNSEVSGTAGYAVFTRSVDTNGRLAFKAEL